LSFDYFGRSSSPANHALTQHFYHCLDAAGLIDERLVPQIWSPDDGRYLPDRYVVGVCPRCDHHAARGDQCDACGSLLDAVDLIAPRSALSGARAGWKCERVDLAWGVSVPRPGFENNVV
jgi:methionyl-tRNA synthetase